MKIAELFVGLGIKGNGEVGKALTGVKSGLGEVKSMSLEAKAAIVGVVYGLERMMSQSAQMGTGLLNFTSLTGMSAQSLQQWQYAARQAGISGEELTGSLKSVQNSMTNMLLGKGAPEGMAMLANKVGFDPAKARDTMYVMQQLQKFAQAVPQDVGNNMLKSFGLSEGTISAMRRNAFRPEIMNKAPTYSEREIGALNKADVAWANLGNKIQMAFGHFTAAHGTQLVNDISKITSAVIHLAEALTLAGEKFKIFDSIGKVLNFFADAIESKPGTLLGEKHLETKILDSLKGSKSSDPYKGLDEIKPIWDSSRFGHPPVPASQGAGSTQQINVNQTLQFQHDGKDAKKTGDSVHKAVKGAFRQIPAQAQES